MSLETAATPRATLDDLMKTPGKAELIGGRIVQFMASGHRPSRLAFRLAKGLDDYAEAVGRGVAYADGVGFAVPELSSGRESFSPDAAYYLGPLPENGMDFIQGAPTLAVEVRSKGDYGKTAERAMAAKRSDYFEAGTLVVWDVDIEGGCINVFRSDAPDRPATFIKGQEADAEPALPGWRLAVSDLFPEPPVGGTAP